MTLNCDVLVVGGGHAGCEAALASARTGAATLLVTQRPDLIACMPCNPSIGGIAKSHLVFELDALGGEMARNTDFTGIHFRVLNTRRGPAVQSNRVQCDKKRYAIRMQRVLACTAGLKVVRARVESLIIRNGKVLGALLDDGSEVRSRCVVVTPGTALNGTIHVGSFARPGAGNGADASIGLSDSLCSLGFKIRRLKTGTPPRIHADSIDYGKLTVQPGEDPVSFFSSKVRELRQVFHVEQSRHDRLKTGLFHVEQSDLNLDPWIPGINQIPCFLTETNSNTHELIHSNLSSSSLYGGHISGTGVRYCPSIEDKIVKFTGKESHHVFLEPEGRNTDWIYPNGLSNSLPFEIQEKMVRSIVGLENARFAQYAFAIEYDFIDPTQLTPSLEAKLIEGLFLAGQINGTTGYEEAASQGFLAGVNASRKVRNLNPIVMDRMESYMGVMVDDLVTKGTNEPYRVFTSRSENRIHLRQDNADIRLVDLAESIGITPQDRIDRIREKIAMIGFELRRLEKAFHEGKSLLQCLRRPDMAYKNLPSRRDDLDHEVIRQVEILVKYDGYMRQDRDRTRRLHEMECQAIPKGVDYGLVRSLRFEAKEKFSHIMPTSLGQASRIPGITPADIYVLSIHLRTLKPG